MTAAYQCELDPEEIQNPPSDEEIAAERDPHGIVPEGFYDRWESFEACVAAVEGEADDERRCPECRKATIVEKRAPEFRQPGNRRAGDYRCVSCQAHFDAPKPPRGEHENQQTLPGVGDDE